MIYSGCNADFDSREDKADGGQEGDEETEVSERLGGLQQVQMAYGGGIS